MEKENKSIWIHKENTAEWRFIGIWADMLYFDISQHLQGHDKESCLILFEKYTHPLKSVQKNLHLRNLYNQYIALFNQFGSKETKEKASQMDVAIENNIKALFEKTDFCIYCNETDSLLPK